MQADSHQNDQDFKDAIKAANKKMADSFASMAQIKRNTELRNLIFESPYDSPALRQLINEGASIDAYDAAGSTAVIAAASTGNKRVLEFLIWAGADVNKPHMASGNTALMFAAWEGQKDCVNMLIKAGADVNALNKSGDTALGWMARWSARHQDMMHHLMLHHAADPLIPAEDGMTAKQRWRDTNDQTLIAFLDQAALGQSALVAKAEDKQAIQDLLANSLYGQLRANPKPGLRMKR